MSTFNGYVKEFPTVRIDCFRKLPEKPRPVVGFLSHIHSDHLQGLESWGKIPLYCSPATRELLLRVETHPHRLNFARGILESRKQHYKGLKNVLRPLPSNTPTAVEVGLERFIRVTLLDANHCIGSVMFLIEDTQTAVLYTGDIRSETWWVNSLVRNPIMIPYAFGAKRLDQIYLDTTFATADQRYKTFQSKSTGIKELLEKVSRYPQNTVFHFHAWTFGYEDVWIVLSHELKTQVHVDDYKRRLYSSLAPKVPAQLQCPEGPALSGFKTGNHFQEGCLTSEKSVRLHSCERGTGCPIPSFPNTVSIFPIICCQENGEILPEKGSGKGKGGLFRNHGYLDLDNQILTKMLINLCEEKAADPTIRSKVRDIITKALESEDQAIWLDATIGLLDPESDIKLDDFVQTLIQLANSSHRCEQTDIEPALSKATTQDMDLPSQIQFSYSRHSSYEELCELVAAFRPCDIHPCTTDWKEWCPDQGVESLFGHLCSGIEFAHDREMASLESQRAILRDSKRPRSSSESQSTSISPVKVSRLSQRANSSAEELPLRAHEEPLHLVKCKGPPRPEQKIIDLRRAFERPLKAAKELNEFENARCDSRKLDPPPTMKNSRVTSSESDLNDGDLQELALYRSCIASDQTSRTKADPIEPPDEFSLTFDLRDHSNYLSEDLFDPKNAVRVDTHEHDECESEISLSDTEFESQLPPPFPQTSETQIERRKHAYKAARDPNGAWADNYSLICLGADHRNDEVEL